MSRLYPLSIFVAIVSAAFASSLAAQEPLVAVGMDGIILRSEDGRNWVEVETGDEKKSLRAVVWGGDRFLTVGERCRFSSPDGKEWKEHRTRDQCMDVAYGDGRYISTSTGRDVEIHTSEDGEKWRKVDLPDVFSQDVPIKSVAFGDGRFVVVANDGALAVSEGGDMIFTREAQGPPSNQSRVLFGGDRFLVVGGENHSLSRNGKDWQAVEIDPEQPVAGNSPKVWTGEFFQIVEPFSGKTYRSQDGSKWESAQAEGPFPVIGDMVFANGLYIGIGHGDAIVISEDGLKWEFARERSNPNDFSRQIRDVAPGQGVTRE